MQRLLGAGGEGSWDPQVIGSDGSLLFLERQNLLPVQTALKWNNLSSEAVSSLALEKFKQRLNKQINMGGDNSRVLSFRVSLPIK